MELNSPLDTESLRLRVALVAMLGAFVVLAGALWRVQVLQGSRHTARMNRQSIRRVQLPGLRGVITDRHGERLADNRPSYCLAVYIEELRQPRGWDNTVDEVERVIDRLAGIMRLERAVSRKDIRDHIREVLPLPFLAWRNLDAHALARWAESGESFPGVDVYVQPVRRYPGGSLAAHVLGYVGRADLNWDAENPYHYYLPDMAGRYGVERSFNERLAGVAGGKLIRVDASGFKHDEESELAPSMGEDIRLTLDVRLQRLAEAALEGETGAIVMVDARNGDVLALASAPAFDLNVSQESKQFATMFTDEHKPLFNRAVSGAYPPGSTFKPLIAIAALENAGIRPAARFSCPGYFELGGVRIRCWRSSGHGSIAMRKAIEQSCNAYFCQLGLKCGYERIYHMADAFGFGHRTDIRLDLEAQGLLPNNDWKVAHRGDSWRSGDTCNVSIGQGALLVTPLQMALFVAAIGNGGFVYHPRVVVEPWEEGNLIQKLAWSETTLNTVRSGMFDVVEAERGTGRRARIRGVTMGGKTGTAEYGPRAERKKFAWMIAFAPFSNPRYGVAIVIEDAMSGGRTAAPRVADLMAGVFGTTPVFTPAPEPETEAAL